MADSSEPPVDPAAEGEDEVQLRASTAAPALPFLSHSLIRRDIVCCPCSLVFVCRQYVRSDEVGRVISLTADERHDGEDKEEEEEEEEGEEGEDVDGEEEESAAQSFARRVASDDSVQGCFSHEDSVYCVDVHGSVACSGDGNDTAVVWNTHTGDVMHVLKGHTDSVTSCAFSFDGEYIATGSMDGTVRVWRSADGSMLHVLEGCTADIEWLQFHPSGPVVVCGSADCSVWLWHAVSGQCMLVLSGHSASVLCGCFSGDGKLVVTGDEAGCVCVWSPKTGQLLHRHEAAHDGPVTALTAHPTRRIALSGGLDGVCRVWSLDTGKALGALRGHSESIESVACSGQSAAAQLAATGGVDGLLCVWDLNTQQMRVACNHPDAVTAVRFDSSQALCYSTCMDGVVRCWDALTGQLLAAWEGHSAAALCLAVGEEQRGGGGGGEAAGMRRLISGSDDHTCLVFAFNANTRNKLDTSHTLSQPTQQQQQQPQQQ